MIAIHCHTGGHQRSEMRFFFFLVLPHILRAGWLILLGPKPGKLCPNISIIDGEFSGVRSTSTK